MFMKCCEDIILYEIITLIQKHCRFAYKMYKVYISLNKI